MNHLFVCREYPPAPGGGIGAYVRRIAALLAGHGETVHIVTQAWEGAAEPIQTECSGRLIIHRILYEDWSAIRRSRLHPRLRSSAAGDAYFPEGFSRAAALRIEKLIADAAIDIIEAQEYEAPLFHYLQRRAEGIGPHHRPACIIHLHSPTAWIARYNDWNLNSASIRRAIRLESFCILHADLLLCPGVDLSRQIETCYGLPGGAVQTIPLPNGAPAPLERPSSVWERGSIGYAGRLERRKGILEWLQAAARICSEDPEVVFEFAGENILGRNPIESELILLDRVPRRFRGRHRFCGKLPRERIPEFLSRARIAVVPSRWENFPYACIEAMASGLPVLATRRGGMAEMIRDGETGWLAETADPDDLARALRRALRTPPEQLARMGSQAALDIHRLCAPETILERQLRLRTGLVERAQNRTHSLPAPPPRLNLDSAVEAVCRCVEETAQTTPVSIANPVSILLRRPHLLVQLTVRLIAVIYNKIKASAVMRNHERTAHP